MPMFEIQFYEDRGDDMPGPWRCTVVEAESIDDVPKEAMKKLNCVISKVKSITTEAEMNEAAEYEIRQAEECRERAMQRGGPLNSYDGLG